MAEIDPTTIAVGYLADAIGYMLRGDTYTAQRQLDHANAELEKIIERADSSRTSTEK